MAGLRRAEMDPDYSSLFPTGFDPDGARTAPWSIIRLSIQPHKREPDGLLPFALCVAFPRSDYYGSSALGVVHL